MAISPEHFWGDNYYNHPPLTDVMVAYAQTFLGVKLPVRYVELLRVQNGGATKGFGYPMQNPPKDKFDYWDFEEMAGIVAKPFRSSLNILDTPEMTEEWGLPPKQVLLNGDGHTWISLDYRDGVVPKVTHIDAECGGELVIAMTFDRFLDGLVPYSLDDGALS